MVGLWLLLRPAEGVQALAFIVGALFLAEAIVKMVFSWQWRNEPKIGWILLSGLLSFIIAMILLTGWPQQSAALLGIRGLDERRDSNCYGSSQWANACALDSHRA